MRSVQKASNYVIWKIETFTEEDTRYKKHCTQDSDTLAPFKIDTLGPHTVLPVTIRGMSYFPSSRQWSEISSFSKVTLVLGKVRSHRAPSVGCSRAESPGRFDVSPENSARDMMHKQAHCCDEAAHHHLSTVPAFRIIWIVSVEECSSLMQNLMQIHCSTHLVILNVTATQYMCSLNSIYGPPE